MMIKRQRSWVDYTVLAGLLTAGMWLGSLQMQVSTNAAQAERNRLEQKEAKQEVYNELKKLNETLTSIRIRLVRSDRSRSDRGNNEPD